METGVIVKSSCTYIYHEMQQILLKDDLILK